MARSCTSKSAPPPTARACSPTSSARPPDRPTTDFLSLVLCQKDPASVLVARSIALFVVAALSEIGGAWLVWQGVREHKGWIWIGAGVIALGLYGFVATLQSDGNFGRILAAYGGVFVAGSIAWGMVADGYRPDRYDITGAVICLIGMGVLMYAPRGN